MLCGSKWTSLAVCGLMLTVVVTDAQAQAPGRPTKPEAIAHFQRGNAHWKLGDFKQALAEYKAGALIEPAPVFLYNVAQCYRKLGNYDQAIWNYDRFLASGTAPPGLKAQIEKLIDDMKAEMQQRAKSAPPAEPATMQPDPEPPAAQPASIQKSVAPWHHDAFGWGLVGAGVAVGAVGAVLIADAASLRSDANTAPSQEQQNALHDKADSRALVGTMLAIGGGAVLVTGIVKLAIHDREPGPTETTWSVGVSLTGVFAFGRF